MDMDDCTRTYSRYQAIIQDYIANFRRKLHESKIIRAHGPFWPEECSHPLFETPKHIRTLPTEPEPLHEREDDDGKGVV